MNPLIFTISAAIIILGTISSITAYFTSQSKETLGIPTAKISFISYIIILAILITHLAGYLPYEVYKYPTLIIGLLTIVLILIKKTRIHTFWHWTTRTFNIALGILCLIPKEFLGI